MSAVVHLCRPQLAVAMMPKAPAEVVMHGNTPLAAETSPRPHVAAVQPEAAALPGGAIHCDTCVSD